MAFGTPPPWLDFTPAIYQRAIESGAETGLGLARLSDASRSSALDRAAREAALYSTLDERQQEADMDRELKREHLAQQLAIEEARGNRSDLNTDRAFSLKEAAQQLANQKNSALQDYRDARLEQAEAGLNVRENATSPEALAARQSAADTIRRRKEIDTYRASAAGARAMLKTWKLGQDPALRDKYAAQAANYDAKATELEAMLDGDTDTEAPTPTLSRPAGKVWSYKPGAGGTSGSLQSLTR